MEENNKDLTHLKGFSTRFQVHFSFCANFFQDPQPPQQINTKDRKNKKIMTAIFPAQKEKTISLNFEQTRL